MAVQQTTRESIKALAQYLTLATALLAVFLITSFHLTRESLWDDEGYTMGFIRDSAASPETLREILQFSINSISNTLARIQTVDVHPPLYYLLVDIWALVAGNSIYAVRLYSTLWGMVALAATYAVGRRLFRDYILAVMAVLLLGTASFFVYYTREARMYTQLIALVVLSMWAYLRWLEHSNVRRALVYSVFISGLLYTHYVGGLIVLTQIIHAVLWGKRSLRIAIPYIVATLLFAPWIPSALAQYRVQGGPGALPLPSDWGSIWALLLLLTNGYGWLYLVAAVFAFFRVRRRIQNLSLIVMWLFLVPVVLLVLNAAVRPLFQMRYVIPILPAFALLIAVGIQNIALWRGGIRFVFLGLLLYLQLTTYSWFWPNKPSWDQSIDRMVSTRQLLEPALTSISTYSPAAYYEGIQKGISLDLAWRWQESYDMYGYVGVMKDSPSIWLVMPSSFASTWDAVTALLADGRHIGHRDTMMNMIFYRFDLKGGDDLDFRFGDALAWEAGIGHQLYAVAGEPFCFDLRFVALQEIDSHYSVDIALTQGYNTRRAEQQLILETYDSGEIINLTPCIIVPANNPLGPHHLRLRVLYNHTPLMLLESENLYWSEELMPALVAVSGQ